MISADAIYSAVRQRFIAYSSLNSIVGGGWRQGRHEQGASADGPYGIITVAPGRVTLSSSFIYKLWTVTAAVYAPASATSQDAIQTAMAGAMDFKQSDVTAFIVSGGSVNMLSPMTVDQRVERDMRSGTDVVPVISAWLMKTVETRA